MNNCNSSISVNETNLVPNGLIMIDSAIPKLIKKKENDNDNANGI